MTAPKAYFAAIPARAFYDRRIDGGRFQLLGAIALSNRLGKGQGCWRSATTLATMTGLDPGTIRNYLGDLISWGYIIREPRPGTKSHRTLFVVYDQQADRQALMRTAKNPHLSSADDALPTNLSSGDAQPVISRDDTRERIEREIGRSPREGNSAEAAACIKHAANHVNSSKSDPEFLRRVQRLLPNYSETEWPLTTAKLKTLASWSQRIDQILDVNGTHGDPVGGWAYRLADEIGFILSEHGVSAL